MSTPPFIGAPSLGHRLSAKRSQTVPALGGGHAGRVRLRLAPHGGGRGRRGKGRLSRRRARGGAVGAVRPGAQRPDLPERRVP